MKVALRQYVPRETGKGKGEPGLFHVKQRSCLQRFPITVQYATRKGGVPMPNWTNAQREAIDARNDMLLVSAAAGSGKTAVLVERILSLIQKDGLDVGRMLVVTFTRAAAAEMRERILKALNEAADTQESLREQALKVDRASISTLHVFCGQVIREHFQAAGLDPTARLIEGGEQDAIFRQAMEDVLLTAHEEGKPGFFELSEQFDDEDIKEMADDLYRFLMSLPDPWRWLHQRMADFPNEAEIEHHPWAAQLLKSLKLQLEGSMDAEKAMLSMLDDPFADPVYEEIINADMRQIEQLVSASRQSVDALRSAWEGRSFPRFPAMRKKSPETMAWGETLKNQRTRIRDGISKIVESVPPDMAQAARNINHTKPALRALMRFTRKLYKRYEDYKREKNVYDFHDLEHKTLAVLKRPELREAVRERFDAVFIDEYQDISGIQEAILQAVHGGKGLFLVGDVKQSIYRFRLADPTLFLQKSREASLAKDASFRRVSLQENFRCAEPVVDAVNLVFESVMREDVTEIGYNAESRLIHGREPGNDSPVELHVLRPQEDDTAEEDEGEETPTRAEREARRAAICIRKLLGQQFMDKDTKEHRPFRWRDIAVLLPKAKNTAHLVAEVFAKEGIPVYSEADEEYFGLPEISTMMALLQVLDNPLQDIPLLTTLRSPSFSVDEETLAMIRLSLSGRDVPFHAAFFHCAKQNGPLGEMCASIAEKLENWRFLSRSLPLDKLMWQLLSQTGIYIRSGALPSGEARQANLRLLCERAASYEQSQGEGLHGFLAHGENLKKSGDASTAKVLGETEDVVRIMTIHKSKGLEFPAVVVMELGGKMHVSSHATPIKIHRELGLGMPCIHPEERIRIRTLAEKSIALRIMGEEKAERARLLYVAMTRARERLILIGTASGKDPARKWAMTPGSYRVWQAGSMLDWIAQAAFSLPEALFLRTWDDFSTEKQESDAETGKKYTSSTGYPQDRRPWNIYVWSESGESGVEKKESIHTQVSSLLEQDTRPVHPEIVRRLSIRMSAEMSRLPLKTSVTSLCKQRLLPGFLPGEDEETPQIKARPEELALPLRLSPLPARPGFLEKKAVSPADLGTATHKALGCLPLGMLKGLHAEALRTALNDGLDRLSSQGLLTFDQRDGLYVDWIQHFFESSWGQRLLQADNIHREWAFNLCLNREPLMLVQGVIDCCFMEDGAWVLIDYKTDFVQDEQAVFERYGPQLQLYRRALEEITGIPVKENVIFLLRTARGLCPQDPRER
jgi:ATP-dependent helicase/nuclease subunit A